MEYTIKITDNNTDKITIEAQELDTLPDNPDEYTDAQAIYMVLWDTASQIFDAKDDYFLVALRALLNGFAYKNHIETNPETPTTTTKEA